MLTIEIQHPAELTERSTQIRRAILMHLMVFRGEREKLGIARRKCLAAGDGPSLPQ